MEEKNAIICLHLTLWHHKLAVIQESITKMVTLLGDSRGHLPTLDHAKRMLPSYNRVHLTLSWSWRGLANFFSRWYRDGGSIILTMDLHFFEKSTVFVPDSSHQRFKFYSVIQTQPLQQSKLRPWFPLTVCYSNFLLYGTV